MDRKIFVDPRTKLLLLFPMNILLLSLGKSESITILRFWAGFLPMMMLLIGGRFRLAFVYVVIYLGSHAVGRYLLQDATGFPLMILGFIHSLGTRFVPGGMMGVYFITTTKVNEFVLAMQKMHVSEKVIIPLSVMFRFFPTVAEESSSISDAMRMRKLGLGFFWRRPLEVIEYRMVPLMISVVNIGVELSASALTRGLGEDRTRTSISDGGFGVLDVFLILLCIGLIVSYFLARGGLF